MGISDIARNLVGPAISSAAGGVASAVGAANVLPLLGFGASGVKAASIAAGIQAGVFGAAVPAGSWFAVATSWGATGVMVAPFAAVAGPVGAVVGGVGWYLFKK